MLLFIPIRTDSPVRRQPIVNYGLIAANVLAFVILDVFSGISGSDFGESVKRRLILDPFNLHLYQFLSYQFLHGDIVHLLGNMLFLWIFGNSVNSKMGNAAYLLFYLAAGIFAGVGFVSGAQNPCLGASGAIAGVTTAFLVLFPHSGITTFYWLWFYIGTMHIRAMLLIVAKIILWDNIISPSLSAGQGYSQVAYSAHIAGYFFGFTLCLFLLWIRALPRDQYDILALIKRFYQRQQFKAAMADPNARAQATFGRVAKTVSVHTGRPVEARAVAVDSEVVRLRAEIAELVARGDYTGAADRYESLVVRDPSQCLPRQNMLMVANQLMTLGRYPQAAAAYEKHLETYPGDRDILQIKFLLGIIYAKYLQQHEAAEGFLRECAKRLTDPDQKKQATEWYQTVLTALGRGPSTTES